QEAELRALRGKPSGHTPAATFTPQAAEPKTGQPAPQHDSFSRSTQPLGEGAKEKGESRAPADVADRIEVGLKRLLDAKDDSERRRALDALSRALRDLRAQPRQPGDTAPRNDSVPEKKGQ